MPPPPHSSSVSSAPDSTESAWSLPGGTRTLAFPSISTGTYSFDVTRAACVCMREVASFLRAHPHEQLAMLMVEPSGEARQALVSAHYAEPGLAADTRFKLAPPDVSLPGLTEHGTPARAIANAANHRLNAKPTTLVNKAVYAAAGPAALEELTRTRHGPSGEAGVAYSVELPADNPLRQAEGVCHVIHLVGPNMNPARPACLGDDYGTGCTELADTYAACFAEFIALLK